MGTDEPVRVVFGVPTYRSERTVTSALRSLLAQRGPTFSVVVVDDASDDRTVERLRAIAEEDARVTVHINASRLGLAENWRRAHALAVASEPDAEFFAWGSDHDLWEPDWLAALTAALDADAAVVLAFPMARFARADGSIARMTRRWPGSPRWRVQRVIAAARHMQAGTMVYGLYRESALARTGGFRRVLLPDRLLLIELARLGTFVQVPETLWTRVDRERPTLERQRGTLFGAEGAPDYAVWPPSWQHAFVLMPRHPGLAVVTLAEALERAVRRARKRRRRRARS